MFSQEAHLLLACAGGPEADPAIRALLAQSLNWRRVLDLSLREGAQPVLGRRVRAVGHELIAGDVVELLRQFERIAEFRALYLRRRLLETVGRLASARIPVVLLKGSALAFSTYGSFGDRPMADLDLLIEPERAREAQGLLLEAGWTRRFKPELDDLYTDMHHYSPLLDDRSPQLHVGLELHTDIIPRNRNPFAFGAQEIWKHAQGHAELPSGALIPRTVHRLLHCCIHYAWTHMFRKSAWRTLLDVSAISRTKDFDWGEFTLAAQRARASSCSYWTLRAARTFAHVPVPAGVLESLRPARSEFLLDLLERYVRHEAATGEGSCPSVRLNKLLWRTAIRPRVSNHGKGRPWSPELAWHLVMPAEAEAHHNPVAWIRYVRAILQPASL